MTWKINSTNISWDITSPDKWWLQEKVNISNGWFQLLSSSKEWSSALILSILWDLEEKWWYAQFRTWSKSFKNETHTIIALWWETKSANIFFKELKKQLKIE